MNLFNHPGFPNIGRFIKQDFQSCNKSFPGRAKPSRFVAPRQNPGAITVKNPDLFMRELHRVLKKDGIVYIGVPNKSRLVGYFGMKDKPFSAKLKQNCIDWKYRLTGRFKNELGAHAGYTEKELQQLMGQNFRFIKPVTPMYYDLKWPKMRPLISFTRQLSLDKILLPSVYVVGMK